MGVSLRKILMMGVSPALLLLAQVFPALAQSTGTQALEGIETVTATAMNVSSVIM